MSKHFLVNPNVTYSDKKTIKGVENRKQELSKTLEESVYQKSDQKLSETDNITHVHDRVVVKIDIDYKNRHQLQNGLVIRRERQFNELNRRVTEPVNAIVISGENIPQDAEILIHPNAIHDTYRIFDYKEDTGNIRYYSIPADMCFAYYDEGWQPLPGFDFALRVFRPYSGFIQGIPPEEIKNCLYVTTGKLCGYVVMTLKSSDYQIIFQDKNLREGNLIRFRPLGDEATKREPEAIAIYDTYTKQVHSGQLLIGLTPSDAKTLEIIPHAK